MGRDGFEDVLKPKDAKTDRQTGAPSPPTKSPCQVPSLKDLGQGSAGHPTSPAAPCRPCPLVAWLPSCRSVPLRSPPLPGQLPRTWVTRSEMRPRARVACTEPLGRRTTPQHTTSSLLLHHYLDRHPESTGARPGRPGALRGPAAASSLQQGPKPSKSRVPSALGRREPHRPSPPDPSLPPSDASPTSTGPTYLLREGVHSAPLLLASVSQPPGPHLRSSPGIGHKAHLNLGLYVLWAEGGGVADETPPQETICSLLAPWGWGAQKVVHGMGERDRKGETRAVPSL